MGEAVERAATIFDGLALPALRMGAMKRSASDISRGSRDETKRSIRAKAARRSEHARESGKSR